MPLKIDSVPDRATITVFITGLAVSAIAFIAKAYQKNSLERPANFMEFLAGLFGAMLFGEIAAAAALEYLSVSFTGLLAISGAVAWLGGDVFRWVLLKVVAKYFKIDTSEHTTRPTQPTQGDPPQ